MSGAATNFRSGEGRFSNYSRYDGCFDGDQGKLPDVISSLMGAVIFGALDIQTEDVAEKETADIRLKSKPL